MSLPTVALIGRPNVGKSTLMNRFIRKRYAVVHDKPGSTRDRNYAVTDWNGVSFRLVDTGGAVPNSDDEMERMIYDQTQFAVHEADLILFLVDARVGAQTDDIYLAKALRNSGKPIILVANKVDTPEPSSDIYDFLRLGLGEPLAISAAAGLGIGELLDALVAGLPKREEVDMEDAIRVAVVGRPNVGKSSFINKLLGEDRLIVSDIAGTTRDAVDSVVEVDGQRFVVVDTAGLRRKYKIHENVEFYTSIRTERAIENCDVAIVLADSQGVTTQDQRILQQVLDSRRAAILAVNKWDLIEKDNKTSDDFKRALQTRLANLSFVPIVFISALSGQRVQKALTLSAEVYRQHHRQIETNELNEFLKVAFGRRKPPAVQGKYIQFKYVTQTETA
ncbi:MAG: ribosome biogenesis GTPase Der, partial [candidate division Zixibacteria bacterium]|nr:ribosome biogenesis GTPase Der [candidate division Zixibacteria bacterium]